MIISTDQICLFSSSPLSWKNWKPPRRHISASSIILTISIFLIFSFCCQKITSSYFLTSIVLPLTPFKVSSNEISSQYESLKSDIFSREAGTSIFVSQTFPQCLMAVLQSMNCWIYGEPERSSSIFTHSLQTTSGLIGIYFRQAELIYGRFPLLW